MIFVIFPQENTIFPYKIWKQGSTIYDHARYLDLDKAPDQVCLDGECDDGDDGIRPWGKNTTETEISRNYKKVQKPSIF